MERLSFILLITTLLSQSSRGQPVDAPPCCTRKTVGGVEYNLVDEEDTSSYNCLSNCVFERSDAPGSRFCFASGELPVNCGDGGTSPSTRQIICNYLPKSDVMQHWKIDLDQEEFESFLQNAEFTEAEDIYNNGGNSMKTSKITLNTPLNQAFAKGAEVVQGGKKIGLLNDNAAVGDKLIKVGLDSTYSNDGGQFEINGVNVGAGSVELRIRTLAGFSTAADEKMKGYDMFGKYKAYYGVGDYAHKFITAALQGQNEAGTNLAMDFSVKDDDFKAESAMKGSAFWSVWMYTIWEMEDAIQDCKAGCSDCNDAPVHAWDEAWAFYTGSKEGKYGNPAGIFPYRLAEDMSTAFKTSIGGKSQVNRNLEDSFLDGKDKLDQGNCDGAKAFKTDISTRMSIPLIQATLHAAYTIMQGDTSSKAKAAAAAFAGSILPQVANCSSGDAETVKNHMWIDGDMGTTGDGFATVKAAFESNYACMGVTCADIGGKDDGAGGYVAGFEPCT